MSTLQDAFKAATSPSLLAQFTAAIWKAATTIVNEDPATQSHAQRITWAAKAILTQGQAQAYAQMVMRLAFSENVTLQGEWAQEPSQGTAVLDADVQTAVNGYVLKFIAAGI